MRVCSLYRSRSLIALLVLVALGLSSLIPVGYMPDFSGHGLIVMCDGIDHLSSQHETDPPCHGHHGHNHTGMCPYGAAAVYGFGGIKAPQIYPPEYAESLILIPSIRMPTQQTAFGNVSPRSPPLFS